MRGGYDYTPIPLSEASCIIAYLFAELALPCSCCNREDNDEIVIQGTAYDGTGGQDHHQRQGGEVLRQATDTRGNTSGPM